MQPTQQPTALGPYTAWMFGPGRNHDFFAQSKSTEPHHLSGIMERPGGHSATASPAPLTGGGSSENLIAPLLWRGLSAPRFLPFILGDANSSMTVSQLDIATLDAMWAKPGDAGVTAPNGGMGPAQAGEPSKLSAGFPIHRDNIDFSAGQTSIAADAAVDASKPLVIIGIIDDGIPFANRALEASDGNTRVEACWMQGATADGSGRVRFGREVTRAEINQLRADHGPDEDAIYRAAGALGGEGKPISAIATNFAHGAHTLGALDEGSDVQVRIVAVDLPPEATWDTSGYGKDMFMLAGLHYIFERAEQIAEAYGCTTVPPLVVNISYGYSGGAHDGNATLEAAMDELVTARRACAPTALTLPSGNLFVDNLHARLPLSPGVSSQALPWRVLPDDRTSSFLEIWLPPDASANDVQVTLNGPGPSHGGLGPVLATFDGGNAVAGALTTVDVEWQGKTVGQITADQARNGRWRFLIALAPTESVNAGKCPAGLWAITLRDKRQSGDAYEASLWIQRDIIYGRGNTGARQSYFDEPANALLDNAGRLNEVDSTGAAVSRHGTLNGLATGSTGLVVGAAKGWGSEAELYSGAGLPGGTEQVNVSAVVTRNLAETGRMGLSPRSHARLRMNGTSASAPAVGAAIRQVMGVVQAGDEGSNYLATLKRENKLAAVTKSAARLGDGTLDKA
ncbi:MAG: hypothetical protein AAGI10_11515 [Pseudomonadota bacterium]